VVLLDYTVAAFGDRKSEILLV